MDAMMVPQGRYYHGWTIVAACILSQVAVNGLAANCFSLFLPGWTAEFHAPASELLLSVALMTLAGSSLAPLVGGWADKYPARWLFGLGLAGNSVFCLAMSFVTAPWQIIALFALLLPFPIVLSAAVSVNSLISRWFVRRLGMAIGLCSFGLGVAGVLLPPVVSALLPVIGWRMLWRIDAALCAVIVLPLVVLAVRNRPDARRDGFHYMTADGADGAPLLHGGSAGPGTLSFGEVFRRRNFWLLVGIVMPLLAVDVAIMHNLAPFAIAQGFSRQVAGQLMSITFVAHLLAALVIGWASDRFGPRLPMATLVVLAVTGCTILAFGHGGATIVLGCVMIGVVGASFTLMPIGIAAEFGQAGFGRAFGCAMFFLPVAVFSSAGFAKIQEMTGSYSSSLMGMACVMIVPATIILFYGQKQAERPIRTVAAEA